MDSPVYQSKSGTKKELRKCIIDDCPLYPNRKGKKIKIQLSFLEKGGKKMSKIIGEGKY
ncbi:MAG: hypothetical protein IH949_11915 [Bacteroidetes bacterium]|nr:hypothetical protein [Bacteroidota bacterium]